jgi:putative tryptophan/tyrosine transport system substrate-binding protein
MRRRQVITLIGGAAVWPLTTRAQQPGHIYQIGFLVPTSRDVPAMLAFFDELRIHGFLEGQNLKVVAGGFVVRNELLSQEAAVLVAAAPDVIVGGPELPLLALQKLTKAIPLVGMTEDMVEAGLVASLSHPGGNTTGISLLSHELDGKRQDLLIETVPAARKIAAFADANVTPPAHLEKLQQAARVRGIELSIFRVAKPEEIIPAINAAKGSGTAAINFLATPLFSVPGNPSAAVVREQVAAARLPAIFQWPETAEEGGLIAYGPRFNEVFRQRARMVVKILRGANPIDMPVEQPTKFELVVNLKAARAIGHNVPAGLVLRADKVIE